jgi:hypothetical protein
MPKKNKLAYKIENLYKNSKLSQDNISKISILYKYIRKKISQLLIDKYKIKPNIHQHGSYALNTIILQKNNEIDLDLGLLIKYDDLNNLCKQKNIIIFFNEIKEIIIKYFINCKKYKFKTIQDGDCAISMNLDNFHIDIALYNGYKNKQCLFYKNRELILDNKHIQYDKIKKILSDNDTLKQMICFTKYIYKNIDGKIFDEYKDSKIPSIAITELYININNVINSQHDIGINLLFCLETIYDKLNNKFEILNSGNSKENLIDNHKRKLNKKNTLIVLDIIYQELCMCMNGEIENNVYLKKTLKNDKILKRQRYYENTFDKSVMLKI